MFWIYLIFAAAVLINGATDAANALTGPVTCDALSQRTASLLTALMNLLGMLVAGALLPGVFQTVTGLANIPKNAGPAALAASLAAVVLFSGAAWIFGIPTSESHGMFAALAGASLALGAAPPEAESWEKVAAGLALSVCGGLAAGYALSVLLKKWEQKSIWKPMTVAGCALTAFFHGAQDGQKFLGMAAAAGILLHGPVSVIGCAVLMLCGTLLGGRRIVDKIGREMTQTDAFCAAIADIGSGIALFAMTVFGLPVSTTHVKMAAVSGSAAGARRVTRSSVMLQVLLAWITTFPACFSLAYLLTKLASPLINCA